MKDELEFLERLFFNTYGHELHSSDIELKVDFIEKDVSVDMINEFDRIKSTYFDIAGRGVSNDIVQSMFEFRAKRLINFKIEIEKKIQEAINELVLPNESNSLVYYNNLLLTYEGVVGILRFITESLFVSLNDVLQEEYLELKYSRINFEKVLEWQNEFKIKYSNGDDFVQVDGMTIESKEYSRTINRSKIELEIKNRLLQPYKDTPLTESRRFGEFISDIRKLINLARKDSEEQKALYQGVLNTLKSILNKDDKHEREKEALNLIIETNITPDLTIEYFKESIDLSIFGKDEKIIKEIVTDFKTRLNKMRNSPSYSDYHLSNIMKLDTITLDELIKYVDGKLVNLESLSLNTANNTPDFGKIKTQLTVAEIALLFKLLVEENIVSISKRELGKLTKQVAATFISKQKGDFSFKSIRKHYDAPRSRTIEEWDKKLVRLRQALQKY
ncbi:hypothetical protein [Marinifilum caeruleilacunae]|uniref:Uncharacterized protein n=1 Tax=Marinifilum caeruleilacunae TaxID=2499076 RepID=A0ABX1X1Q3_9BACT|nr:hypothetical protein [Marinifilum caeruleilacunae]NOU62305.1 hypothetical protein [Marinifilum caeruleilacunae]